jgi:hypothetical protein
MLPARHWAILHIKGESYNHPNAATTVVKFSLQDQFNPRNLLSDSFTSYFDDAGLKSEFLVNITPASTSSSFTGFRALTYPPKNLNFNVPVSCTLSDWTQVGAAVNEIVNGAVLAIDPAYTQQLLLTI